MMIHFARRFTGQFAYCYSVAKSQSAGAALCLAFKAQFLGTGLAQHINVRRKTTMGATQPVTIEMPPCSAGLSELQVPMINAMVSCLSSDHRRLDEQTSQLALAAGRFA